MSVRGKILLMGNPNVGKSVFFTMLTGINAVSSNYTGTTVSFLEGNFTVGKDTYTLIDVPGTYSLKPTSEAETTATQFLQAGASAVICVLDATNLERNLCLALEMRKYNIPTVYVLNMLDVANRQGIEINEKLLSLELSAPVVKTVAVKKQGVDELKAQLEKVLADATPAVSCSNCTNCPRNCNDNWVTAKEIAQKASRKNNAKPSFTDRFGDAMIRPFPGLIIALLACALLIGFVVGGGIGIRAIIFRPLVDSAIVPFFRFVFESFVPEGMILNILIGEFGIFVISFEWIVALIFPYVLMFYIAFSFFEDSGYLPRLSVLFDNIMRKLGMQGGSLVYVLMGLGCAVPAILSSRAATSRRERLIVTAAICFAVPCMSQTGALIALFAGFYWWMMPLMLLFTFMVFATAAFIAGKLIKGKTDPLLLEIPNFLIPSPKSLARKIMIRMKHFLADAQGPMMVAIVVAAVLAESGLLNTIAVHAQPLVSSWLGLPAEAVVGLILGIVRREMSVAPLIALDLMPLQAFVAGVVSLLYLPCLSVVAILTKEFKLKVAAILAVSTIVVALLVGGIINQIGQLFLS